MLLDFLNMYHITQIVDWAKFGNFGINAIKRVRHQENGVKVSGHFGTKFFGVELSRCHLGLVPNCLCALTSIRRRKTTRLCCKNHSYSYCFNLSTLKLTLFMTVSESRLHYALHHHHHDKLLWRHSTGAQQHRTTIQFIQCSLQL